jgi:hypothetical protein
MLFPKPKNPKNVVQMPRNPKTKTPNNAVPQSSCSQTQETLQNPIPKA